MATTLRRILGILLALGIAGAAGATEANYRATCRYFESAAFNDRHVLKTDTFRIRLAEDCRDAIAVQVSSMPGSAEWTFATGYLARLEEYRATMIGLAAERRELAGSRSMRQVLRSSTRSSEFLIAKVMGLLDSREAWLYWRAAAVAD